MEREFVHAYRGFGFNRCVQLVSNISLFAPSAEVVRTRKRCPPGETSKSAVASFDRLASNNRAGGPISTLVAFGVTVTTINWPEVPT